MSAFLGKIHYLLYDKILWFESLENQIIKWSNENNLPIDQWLGEMNRQYGETTGGVPLEDIIDTSNIHGWLQGKISVAEARQAYLVTRIVELSPKYKDDLKNVFNAQGELAAANFNDEVLGSPEEVYNALNEYILEGMPCDRVNQVLESNDNLILWHRTMCLHENFWTAVKGNVANFYKLRESWIESFVNSLKGNFKYEKVSQDTQKIYR